MIFNSLRAWIFTNHSPEQTLNNYNTINSSDFVIAVDNGLTTVDRLGLKPSLILGDFDSLTDPQLLVKYQHIQIIECAASKNETDTELAINWCIEKGVPKIIICNDLQGRFDHALAIVQNLVFAHHQGVDVCIDSGRQIVLALDGKHKLHFRKGDLLSMIAWSDVVNFIFSTGLQYPLNGLEIHANQSRGISNALTADCVELEIGHGTAISVITPMNKQ